jgi:two-component system, chemotaxis family, chemotaxis protein CheY
MYPLGCHSDEGRDVPTVLIADDSEFMRVMVRRILGSAGYDVVGEASSGESAVERFESLRPDLLTLDLAMPCQDGHSPLARILAIDPTARILTCSVAGQEAAAAASILDGARDHLTKPFHPDGLLAAIASVLDGDRYEMAPTKSA